MAGPLRLHLYDSTFADADIMVCRDGMQNVYLAHFLRINSVRPSSIYRASEMARATITGSRPLQPRKRTASFASTRVRIFIPTAIRCGD